MQLIMTCSARFSYVSAIGEVERAHLDGPVASEQCVGCRRVIGLIALWDLVVRGLCACVCM